MPTSRETRLPTETFLIPGQQTFTVKPWEIASLPRASTPRAARTGAPAAEAPQAPDPLAGLELGACTVIRRLSADSDKHLLALRDDGADGATLVVLRKLELEAEQAQEALRLSRRASRLHHESLARVFPSELGAAGAYWVSERASGATLAELSAACRKLGKALPLGLVLPAVVEAAHALGELNAEPHGAAHGLVSPQSVVLCFDGSTRLLDAGLFGCIGNQRSWAEVLEAVGPYLAPEQLLQGYPPNPKSDVYALASVLGACLSGRPLPTAQGFEDRVRALQAPQVPPSRLNPALGTALDAVLERALSRDRAVRFPDGRHFAQALAAAAAPFCWKRAQRAQFVSGLFEARHRQEQVLLAGCAPRRSLTSPLLQVPVLPREGAPPMPTHTDVEVPALRAPRLMPIAERLPQRATRPAWRWLAAAALAAALGAFAAWRLGLVPSGAPAAVASPGGEGWESDAPAGGTRPLELERAAVAPE